jgi:hypothetical protein
LLTKNGDIALQDPQHDEHSDAGKFNEGMVPLADDEDEKAVHNTNNFKKHGDGVFTLLLAGSLLRTGLKRRKYWRS